MQISFTMNQDKALQTLLWILNQKPGINVYNIMKVVFAADCFHLNEYGRPIYGDTYKAMKDGTVPSFMYDLTKLQHNVPFFHCSKNGLQANSVPNMSYFSESDLEALEYGLKEYADLSFGAVREKNHQHRAWKNHEAELNAGRKAVDIDYKEMIDNPEVLADLNELGHLTESMVL